MGVFLMMLIFGIIFNVISLFGFILVFGIVVDDVIVIGENVYIYLKIVESGE